MYEWLNSEWMNELKSIVMNSSIVRVYTCDDLYHNRLSSFNVPVMSQYSL